VDKTVNTVHLIEEITIYSLTKKSKQPWGWYLQTRLGGKHEWVMGVLFRSTVRYCNTIIISQKNSQSRGRIFGIGISINSHSIGIRDSIKTLVCRFKARIVDNNKTLYCFECEV